MKTPSMTKKITPLLAVFVMLIGLNCVTPVAYALDNVSPTTEYESGGGGGPNNNIINPYNNVSVEVQNQYDNAGAGQCNQYLNDFEFTTWIYCYTAKIFRLLMIFSSVLTVVLLVWGGWQYTTSTGVLLREGKVEKSKVAREIIYGALFGFFITMFSLAIATYTANMAERAVSTPPPVNKFLTK